MNEQPYNIFSLFIAGGVFVVALLVTHFLVWLFVESWKDGDR